MFTTEIEEYKSQVLKRRLIQTVVCSGAIVTLASALINPNKAKGLIMTELGVSSLFGFMAAYISYTRDELEGKYNSLVNMDKEHTKKLWSTEFANAQMGNDIIGELKIAQFIRDLPHTAQLRYMEMYNLRGLVALNPPKQEIHQEYEVMDVTAAQIARLEANENRDLSWYSKNFVYQSCIISGKKGSGKSVLLKHKASRAKVIYPDAIILIIDPHYDESDSKNDWFCGIPYDEKKSIIADDKKSAWKMIQSIACEVHRRIDNRLKNEPPLMVYIDEWEAVLGYFNDTQQDLLIETVAKIQNECRKYRVEINIGNHSMKKEITKLDSSVTSQMTWVLFGSIVTDRNTVFPSNFDQKAITKEFQALEHDETKERKIVLLNESGEFCITTLPLLPAINFNKSVSEEKDNVQDNHIAESSPTDSTKTSMEQIEVNPEDEVRDILDQYFYDLVIWAADQMNNNVHLTPSDVYTQWVMITGVDPAFNEEAKILFYQKVIKSISDFS